MKTKSKQSAFTLLEIIVSLALLTIALSAIITVGSNRAETLLELRDRNRALIVANNVLEGFYNKPISEGVFDGSQKNGGMHWNWQVKVSSTNNEQIYRLDTKVSKNTNFDYAFAQLTGFKWH